MARAKASDEQEMKQYRVDRQGETLMITVPASWKVTFGPVNPGSKYGGGGDSGLCLRFYESQDKQRAIFTQVKSFIDTSIEIQKLVRDVKAKSESETGPRSAKSASETQVDERWESVF